MMKSTASDNISKVVAKILFESGCIIFRPRQPFRYTTGILSPVYVDIRYIISYPKARKKIAEIFVDKIKKIGMPDVIAGTATAGIPHAAWVAAKLNLPMIYVRTKPKEHGKENMVEGILKRGQRVIIIEDLVTTGTSSIAVVNAVRKLGGIVNHEFAIYSYQLKESVGNFKRSDITLHYLTDLKTVAETAQEQGFLKPDQVETILDWSQDPKNWGKKNLPAGRQVGFE